MQSVILFKSSSLLKETFSRAWGTDITIDWTRLTVEAKRNWHLGAANWNSWSSEIKRAWLRSGTSRSSSERVGRSKRSPYHLHVRGTEFLEIIEISRLRGNRALFLENDFHGKNARLHEESYSSATCSFQKCYIAARARVREHFCDECHNSFVENISWIVYIANATTRQTLNLAKHAHINLHVPTHLLCQGNYSTIIWNHKLLTKSRENQ